MKNIYILLLLLLILILIILFVSKKKLNIETFNNQKLSDNSKNLFFNEKLHLISYGDKRFERAKNRIFNEAIKSNWFYSVKCYNNHDLTENFRNEFKNILSMKRGGGYWIWKFDIILQRLKEIDNGDFLIYLDSGCSININGEKKLKDYINLIKNKQHKIISFQMGFIEEHWTTKEIFKAFNVDKNDSIKKSGQFCGGLLIMQKCDAIINLFQECLNILRNNKLLITDVYNKKQSKYFRDNRHDQSILSISRKKYGSIVIKDNTNYSKKKPINKSKIPFLATRKN